MEKSCSTCGAVKALDQFHRRGAHGRQSICISCRKELDAARWAKDPWGSYVIRKSRKDSIAEWARSLKDAPCVDCGGSFHFRAMHWDHIGNDKEENVSVMVLRGLGRKKILAEIAKCELVCANCHAVRTYKRERNGI